MFQLKKIPKSISVLIVAGLSVGYLISNAYSVTQSIQSAQVPGSFTIASSVSAVASPAVIYSNIFDVEVRSLIEKNEVLFNIPWAGKATITMFDAMGRNVSQPLNEILSQGQHLVELGKLPKGLYFVRFSFEGKSIVKTLAPVQ